MRWEQLMAVPDSPQVGDPELGCLLLLPRWHLGQVVKVQDVPGHYGGADVIEYEVDAVKVVERGGGVEVFP